MILIVKKFSVSAAYRIDKQGCGEAYTGTNLDILVGYSGPVDPVLGMIVNMNDIKAVVSQLLEPYDHACIAPDKVFTKESLLSYVLDQLWATLSGADMENGRLEYLQVGEDSGIRMECGHWGRRGGRTVRLGDEVPGSLAGPVVAELLCPDAIPDSPREMLSMGDATMIGIAKKTGEIKPQPQAKVVWKLLGGELDVAFDGEGILLTAYDSFDKAHALGNSTLSDEENEAIFGPCSEQHGHRYHFGLSVHAQIDDFDASMALVQEAVRDMHGYLHQAQSLDIPVMTGENIISLMRKRAEASLGSRLGGITLQETGSIYFLDVDDRWTGL